VAAYVPGAGDVHIYPRAPHDAEIIKLLRTAGEGGKNIYVSEYGIASGVDLARLARQFEQRVDAQVYYTRRSTFRQRLEQFRQTGTDGRWRRFSGGRRIFSGSARQRWPASGRWASMPSVPIRISTG